MPTNLGFHDDKLFMATDKSVLSYSLSGEGKLHQHRLLGGHSYGRGFHHKQSGLHAG